MYENENSIDQMNKREILHTLGYFILKTKIFMLVISISNIKESLSI